MRDGIGARGGIASQQSGTIRLAPGKEVRVVDQAIFDDFGIARAELAAGEGGQRRGVDDDQRRLMKGADQIFARGDVDRGLAADAAIDLRE